MTPTETQAFNQMRDALVDIAEASDDQGAISCAIAALAAAKEVQGEAIKFDESMDDDYKRAFWHHVDASLARFTKWGAPARGGSDNDIAKLYEKLKLDFEARLSAEMYTRRAPTNENAKNLILRFAERTNSLSELCTLTDYKFGTGVREYHEPKRLIVELVQSLLLPINQKVEAA